MSVRYLIILSLMSFTSLAYADMDKKQPALKLLCSREDQIPTEIAKEIGIKEGHFLYSLEFYGFPKNKEIIEYSKRLENSDFVLSRRFKVLADGGKNHVKCDGCGDYLSFMSMNFLPGETLYLAFETNEGEFLQDISLQPNPILIEGKSKNELLRAELLSIFPTVYAIYLYGIPNENVKIHTYCGESQSIIQTTYVPTQGVALLLNPGNCIGGEAKIDVKTDNDTFSFHLPWGEEIRTYAKEQRPYKN